MSNDKVWELFYEWFRYVHPDYTDEQIMWSYNQDDIGYFVSEVEHILEKGEK